MVLLDDVDTITNKAHVKALNELISDLLEIGRHSNTTVIISSHLINGHDKQRMRTILNESHRIILFPRTTTAHALGYFFREYGGISDKKFIKKLNDLNTRSICFHKNFPMYILHSDGAFML